MSDTADTGENSPDSAADDTYKIIHECLLNLIISSTNLSVVAVKLIV